MGNGALTAMPEFAEFYRAINGRDPFPWQRRLAELVATSGQWPVEIGVPTGLGKTACLDMAVWWLASQADRVPVSRSAPTRIWWVVNRRLLVDSTAEHAERIAEVLHEPDSAELTGAERKIVTAVASRLRSLAADAAAPPLDVIRLRGGLASRTPVDPSQPTVVLCTLPMYGSRLLFRGYGSRQWSRSVDAAMAGTDSLVLLDEAHLAPHLGTLADALTECTPGALAILGDARSRTQMVALTATGDTDVEGRFDLDVEDEAHSIVRQRLDATKPVEVRIESGDCGRRLADAALEIVRRAALPTTCLVFANAPKTARNAFGILKTSVAESDAEVLLLTGRTREREAERIRSRILDPGTGMGTTGGEGVVRQRHLIVVATQTLEVGADLDAEHLVTEACGVRALTQRLGRLNRLGKYTRARAVYVHLPPAKKGRGKAPGKDVHWWPIYGEEPRWVLEKLQDACGDGGGTVDLAPRRVAEVLGPPGDRPGRAPEILPEILWEWMKTTTPPHGEAPVEPYFSGIDGPTYTVSVIWRVHLPEPGNRLWPRPTDREAVDVPIVELRDLLQDEHLCRLAPDGVTVEVVSGSDLRPGDRIVLPTDRGLLDEFGWNPTATDAVVDMSLSWHGIPLDPKAIRRLGGASAKGVIDKALGTADDGGEAVDPPVRAEAVEEILGIVRSAAPVGWSQDEWIEFTGMLSSDLVESRGEVARLPVRTPVREEFASEFDETSLAPVALELELHCKAVAERARDIANRIGVPPEIVAVVERAGRFHDLGKADRRFQRWLDPGGSRGVLVAKSNAPRHRWEAMRAAAGWPRGGRHEDLSARLVRAWLDHEPGWGDPVQQDLLLHLIISHHGKGRPLIPPVVDATPDSVSGTIAGVSVTVSADLGTVDWDQPGRFRRLSHHFGPWGLALLEAIVIRSDHRMSGGAVALRREAPE